MSRVASPSKGGRNVSLAVQPFLPRQLSPGHRSNANPVSSPQHRYMKLSGAHRAQSPCPTSGIRSSSPVMSTRQSSPATSMVGDNHSVLSNGSFSVGTNNTSMHSQMRPSSAGSSRGVAGLQNNCIRTAVNRQRSVSRSKCEFESNFFSTRLPQKLEQQQTQEFNGGRPSLSLAQNRKLVHKGSIVTDLNRNVNEYLAVKSSAAEYRPVEAYNKTSSNPVVPNRNPVLLRSNSGSSLSSMHQAQAQQTSRDIDPVNVRISPSPRSRLGNGVSNVTTGRKNQNQNQLSNEKHNGYDRPIFLDDRYGEDDYSVASNSSSIVSSGSGRRTAALVLPRSRSGSKPATNKIRPQ